MGLGSLQAQKRSSQAPDRRSVAGVRLQTILQQAVQRVGRSEALGKIERGRVARQLAAHQLKPPTGEHGALGEHFV